MPRCGGVPYPRRCGGGRPLWLVLRDALLARFGEQGYPTDTSTVHYVRVVALARQIAATYGTAVRLKHARDPWRMDEAMVLRWERMLSLPIYGTWHERRARLAKILEREGVPALGGLLEEDLREAVGATFLSLQRIDPEVARIVVPNDSYPWGTVTDGSTFTSTVGRLLAYVAREATDSEAAFYEKAGRVVAVLDAAVSAWTEIDWYRAPGGPYGTGTDVANGPVQAGFYLDDTYNLDNCIFDTNPTVLETLSWSGLWLAPYASSPWQGSPSLGLSGERSLVTAGTAPTVGPLLNGHAAAGFDGTRALQSSGFNLGNLVGVAPTGWTFFAVYNPTSLPVAGPAYDGHQLITETGGWLGVSLDANGIRAWMADGNAANAIVATSAIATPTATTHILVARWTGTHLQARVGATGSMTAAQVAVSAVYAPFGDIASNNIYVGQTYAAANRMNGNLWAHGVLPVSLTDDEVDGVCAALRERFDL